MKGIERRWYSSPGWLLLLAPFSALFALLTSLRRKLYGWGVKRVYRPPLPVVVVGNLSVGGNGKTPVVIWLCEYFQQKGLNVGVISRGYGGKASQYPLLVDSDSLASEVGDEPLLIAHRLGVPVAVSPVRADAIALLVKQFELDLIISDDGLQHYAMARDLEIVVLDGQRRFGNGWLLPVGPLRELPSRLKPVDVVINNGGEPQFHEISMRLQPDLLVNMVTGQRRELRRGEEVNAMAGIGAPERFFATLRLMGARVCQQHAFADHHPYQKEDIAPMLGTLPLLMTEKDAVKCRDFIDDNCWYLPVSAQMAPELAQQLDNWIEEHCHVA